MKKLCLLFITSLLFSQFLYSQPYQTIRGVVVEKSSKIPIAYAAVIISDIRNSQGVTSDSLGRFVLHKVPVGRHDISVSCLGYEPKLLKEVLVSSSKEVVLEIHLQKNLIAMNEVVVKPSINKTEPLNEMALAGGHMLSVEEASRYAGSMDDPARLVSSFAGVASTVGNNGIVVRGNAPKFLQWRMEGVEIPNPNHFAEVTSFGGGGLTALSSQVLSNSDFYIGAFPAEYGNALSGVFDMYLRNGNNMHYEHTLQLGVLGIDVASEGPFSKNYNGSYLFNYRYSTLSLLAPLLPADAEGTNYQDLSFKFSFPSHRAGTFSVWGVGLIDHSGTVAENDPTKWVYDQDMENQEVKQYMGAVGINHNIHFGTTSLLKTSFATTVSGLDMHTEQISNTGILFPKNVIQNTNWNLVFSSSLRTHFSERHINQTGIRLTGLLYNQFMQNTLEPGNQLQTLTDATGMSALLSLYSTSIVRLASQWNLSLGIHTQWFALNDHYTVEPRLSLKYQFLPDHSLSLAYGMHSRLEMLNYYFTKKDEVLINHNLDFTKAHHLSISYDWTLGTDRHLKIEPYFQYSYDIPVVPGTTTSFANLQGGDDWFLTEQLINAGKGLNYGIDITFERFLSRGLYYMATASIFDARFQTAEGEWFNTRYNRNFVLNFLIGKEWMLGSNHQNLLGINGRVTLQGGDRYSPIDEKESAARQEAVYNEQNPYSQQLEPVFLGHLTVSYKINRKKIAHEFALKILNITGYKDYYGHRYNHLTGCVEAEREANIIPNLCYKIEF